MAHMANMAFCRGVPLYCLQCLAWKAFLLFLHCRESGRFAFVKPVVRATLLTPNFFARGRRASTQARD